MDYARFFMVTKTRRASTCLLQFFHLERLHHILNLSDSFFMYLLSIFYHLWVHIPHLGNINFRILGFQGRLAGLASTTDQRMGSVAPRECPSDLVHLGGPLRHLCFRQIRFPSVNCRLKMIEE